MPLSILQLAEVCTHAPLQRLAPLVGPYHIALQQADAEAPLREALLLANMAEETAEFRWFEEQLSYSAEAIVRTWPTRFPTLELARPFAHNPPALANRVYSDRNGNGPEASGNGWRYRGRGALMLTGLGRYHAAAEGTGLPLVTEPDLVAHPAHAFEVAAWLWRHAPDRNGVMHDLNIFADAGDVKGCRLIVNGGLLGLDQVENYFSRARGILHARPAVA